MKRIKPFLCAALAAGALLTSANSGGEAAGPGAPASPAIQTRQSTVSAALLASTFLGGSGEDEITGTAFDQNRSAYVVGTSNSPRRAVTRWLLTPIVFAVEYPLQSTGLVFLLVLLGIVLLLRHHSKKLHR